MSAARFLSAGFLVFFAVVADARADDYPQGLIREQLEQATRRIELDLTRLQPGDLETREYVGRPVYVYRRTKAERAPLAKGGQGVADPRGANMPGSLRAAYGSSASLVWARLLLVDQPTLEKRRTRSYRDEYLVVGGWSPRSGCRLDFHPAQRRQHRNVVFTDSCLGGSFDASGRALLQTSRDAAAQPAGAFNLYIPPHRFEARDRLVIGVAEGARVPELGFSHARLYRANDPTHNLIVAARYGDAAMIETALADSADVNSFRQAEGSPLDAAIIGSSVDTVKLLIEHGARPTARSIRSAEFVGRKEVWELLERMAVGEKTR